MKQCSSSKCWPDSTTRLAAPRGFSCWASRCFCPGAAKRAAHHSARLNGNVLYKTMLRLILFLTWCTLFVTWTLVVASKLWMVRSWLVGKPHCLQQAVSVAPEKIHGKPICNDEIYKFYTLLETSDSGERRFADRIWKEVKRTAVAIGNETQSGRTAFGDREQEDRQHFVDFT